MQLVFQESVQFFFKNGRQNDKNNGGQQQNEEPNDNDSQQQNDIQNKNVNGSQQQTNNFGFKSLKSPPADHDLDAFEQDIRRMIRNVKFENKPKPDIQKRMDRDIKMIKQQPNL